MNRSISSKCQLLKYMKTKTKDKSRKKTWLVFSSRKCFTAISQAIMLSCIRTKPSSAGSLATPECEHIVQISREIRTPAPDIIAMLVNANTEAFCIPEHNTKN